jgi:serine/threonine-protein kinase RsbW
MTESGNNNSITFPSKTNQVAVADEFLETWLREHGISEDTIADMAIAITELVNNAIKHGNKLQKDKTVTLELQIINKSIKATVMDQGTGFKIDSIPDPLAEENLLKEIGRGIFIVKSMMDDVKFDFSPDGGTKVTVTKNID